MQTSLSDGTKLFTTGLPGSGALLSFILNVFEDYGFTSASLADFNATALTYHRMIETFKYAYSFRTNLGDGAYVDMTEVSAMREAMISANELDRIELRFNIAYKLTRNLTSKSFARAIRERINDERTWQDPRHYGSSINFGAEDHGTAHVSILAPNGDAVSVTSTINY